VGRFLEEGAIGVSPHIIPHRSTHSLSGTISLAFAMHGLNHGVGGADGALVEGLLAALAILGDGNLPGLWLVLTEWDPEPVPEEWAAGTTEAVCHAVAMALMTGDDERARSRLRLIPEGPEDDVGRPLPTVAKLAEFLKGSNAPSLPRSWRCPLEWGATLEISASLETAGNARGADT
jgi:hypothetical protein